MTPRRSVSGRTVCAFVALTCCFGPAVAAHADPLIDAKLQCQIEYVTPSDQATACLRGVELAAASPERTQDAMEQCGMRFGASGQTGSCQRGVGFYQRVTGKLRSDDKSTFSYSWQQKRGALQFEAGNYQFLIGDAEKSIDDCMRAFEGSSVPPSCLSGFTTQQKPPPGPPK